MPALQEPPSIVLMGIAGLGPVGFASRRLLNRENLFIGGGGLPCSARIQPTTRKILLAPGELPDPGGPPSRATIPALGPFGGHLLGKGCRTYRRTSWVRFWFCTRIAFLLECLRRIRLSFKKMGTAEEYAAATDDPRFFTMKRHSR